MKKFKVTWKETREHICEAEVEAETKEDAVQICKDGEYDDYEDYESNGLDSGDYKAVEVDE